MEKLTLLFVVVYMCICVCRAQSPPSDEVYKILASTTSGSGKELTWITTDAKIIDAIKNKFMPNAHHDHAAHASAAVPELPPLLGYRGMLIQHINRTQNHTWVVPKCSSASLERSLIQDCINNHKTVCVPVPANTVPEPLFEYIDTTINKCPSTAKPVAVVQDVWKVTVKFSNLELTWNITEKDGSLAGQLINYIKKSLFSEHHNTGTHAHAPQSQPPMQWPVENGYKGMRIAHFQNGIDLHHRQLGICFIPDFQKYALRLFSATTPTEVTIKNKINLHLEGCPKKTT